MLNHGKLQAFIYHAMKSFYLRLLLPLLLPLCASSVAAAADFSEVNPEGIALDFTIIATGEGMTPEVEISGFTAVPADTVAVLTLPGSITHDGTTYNVTAVGEDAFEYKKIKSVVVGEGIITLKENSLYGCGISDIALPESLVTIARRSFTANKIENLYIPKSVRSIGGENSFDSPANSLSIASLKNISVADDNECFSSYRGILYNKEQKTLLYCPIAYPHTLLFSDSIISIGREAFMGNKTLKELVFLPDMNIHIGSNAFEGAGIEYVRLTDSAHFTFDTGAFKKCKKLKEIYIGAGVSDIGFGIIKDCSNLGNLIVSPENPKYSSDGIAIFDKEQTLLYTIRDSYDGDYVIPSTVKELPDQWGWGYGTRVDHLTIPESVEKIAWNAHLSGKIIIENPDVSTLSVGNISFVYATSITVPLSAVEDYKTAWPEYADIINGGEYEMSVSADEPLSTKKAVMVPVSLRNADEIIGFQCDVHLPYSCDIAKDENGRYVIALTDRAGKSHSVTSGVVTDGTELIGYGKVVRVVCISMTNAKIKGNDGVLFNIPVILDKISDDDEIKLAIDNIHLSKPGNVREDLPWVQKYFSAIDYLPGDADDDGQVSVVDVTCSISHMIGQTPPRFNLGAVDFDKDEAILINDVTTLVDMVLSTDNSVDEAAAAPRRSPANDTAPADAMTMDNVSATPNSEAQLAISMTNEQNIIGFQCDITLPEGVTINQSDGENYDIELSPDRSDDHFVASKKVAGKPNTVRVLAASLTNAPFIGHEGVVFTCPVTVNVPENDYEITVSNIILSAEGNNRIDVPSYKASLSVGTSGIAQPVQEAAEESPEQYYDLQGRPADASTRGIIVSKKGKRLVK